MKLGKILLCIAIIYLLIGFGYVVYEEITADPEDTPVPIWASGLSLGERIGHFLLVFIPSFRKPGGTTEVPPYWWLDIQQGGALDSRASNNLDALPFCCLQGSR